MGNSLRTKASASRHRYALGATIIGGALLGGCVINPPESPTEKATLEAAGNLIGGTLEVAGEREDRAAERRRRRLAGEAGGGESGGGGGHGD